MFGYITVNKDTLSEENKKIYQSYYCGLCQTMKSQYGRRAQMALNYDMTFLIVLLTGLYEPDSVTRDGFVCSVHPTKKRTLRTNEITEYAAAMNILLAYYNLIDDWKDDKSLTKKTYAEMLKKDFEKAKKGYPIQAKAIEDYIARLAECEKSNDTNIDAVAGLTGEMLGILFAWKQDEWQKDLKEFGYRADGILAQVYASIPKSTIDRLENCKGIAVYGGGYDRIDVAAARTKNISVTNISGYCAEDLADYVVAAMYFVNKGLAFYSRTVVEDVKAGKWGAMAALSPVHRLENQTLGIVGLGVIGKTVAKRAQALGIHVIAFDDFVDKKTMSNLGVEKVSWEDIFKRSDYISVHLKGCDENTDKIDAAALSYMKDTAWLINTSRGKVVSEDALIDAVKSKKIGGAILDVMKTEPPAGDEPILHVPNIYVTPHVSYISIESFKALKDRALENLENMLAGKRPRDLVN